MHETGTTVAAGTGGSPVMKLEGGLSRAAEKGLQMLGRGQAGSEVQGQLQAQGRKGG